ncbi:pyruvate dehydrogenase (acetyl-transferring) E1 component subunit alpha [Halanaerobium sp. Z-7514]|uniref:Pyruvate dehydrogenase E1 component subunit alpha n=1 Tax=Halanaerobium polyolivorans TaxID=2886943 RepID=A0AAW4WUE9_9FIRM|nr:pyruvate dehydrogenase (acetyl-transferring) E1 component subunit alpha [Halanaerobium polyolivorans]MCC3144636.1 pyruvate dehydrogenase (acetyl-transferring) E1 component subunit alpha [Halanaerobium polyolivorans]RQD74819.1 MAG: pyruvate dehydrogenase (acetyl-transferring) E1 component subunit alpha [Halanaerobium sp. MSAO_Bac5]
MELSEEKLLKMYQDMIEIREFERKVDYFISHGDITGTTHLYIGEEAIAVGAINAAEEKDYISSTHRGHGHSIAKGVNIKEMMAELFGKTTGSCKGKGGSLHIVDSDTNNLGANGIVGGGIPIAVGAALAAKMQENGEVILCFFSDGAMNQGAFHEAVNMASVWDLPVVFICENNQYGMSTSVEKAFNIQDLSARAKAYNIPGVKIDGNKIMEVYEVVQEAVERARQDGGPSLIVAETYRWKGHSKSDAKVYRTKEEEKAWKERDPIAQFEEELKAQGILDEQKIEDIREEIDEKVEAAVKFAQESPFPDKEDIYDDVYVDGEVEL